MADAPERSMSVAEIASVCGGRIAGDGAATVRSIAYDSRNVQPGSLFVALVGAEFDGHDFVGDAVDRGAVALLVERPAGTALPEILVKHTRAALSPVAAAYYGHPPDGLRAIGITGTDGKTTTSFLTSAILRRAGFRVGLIGTVGVRIGDDWYAEESRQTTPESLDVHRFLRWMADADVSHVVIEATSHGLAMHRLDDVQFSIAAVTNVTHEHLDYHGTIDAYRQAKGKLFALTGERAGSAVINLEDDGARAMRAYARGCQEVIDYGVDRATASIGAQNLNLAATGSVFDLRVPGAVPVEVRLPLIGRFNVENALCAAAIAHVVGIDSATIAEGLSDAPTIPGRLAGIDEGQPFAVIVDYAHTPDALAKILSLLRDLNPAGRLIVVFGSAGERDIDKRARQGEIAARLADYFVITSEDPRHEDPDAIIAAIAAGAAAAGAVEEDHFSRVTDRRDAIRIALAAARPGDCVLLAGKGHERSIIWGREKRPWDEAAVVRDLLREMGWSSPGIAEP